MNQEITHEGLRTLLSALCYVHQGMAVYNEPGVFTWYCNGAAKLFAYILGTETLNRIWGYFPEICGGNYNRP